MTSDKQDGIFYGFFLSLIFVSFWLFLQYGEYFNFVGDLEYQFLPVFSNTINWWTVVLLSTLLIFLYKSITFPNKLIDRLKYTFLSALFPFGVYDMHHWLKQYFVYNDVGFNNTIRVCAMFLIGVFYFGYCKRKQGWKLNWGILVPILILILCTYFELVYVRPYTQILDKRYFIETLWIVPFILYTKGEDTWKTFFKKW